MSGAAIDVMIPTRNEAAHIAEVVANASQIGRVFVLDSCSTDGTQTLAREAGATVVEHPFEGYAAQKNWGLDHLPLEGDWVFILDADERITPALRDELLAITKAAETRDAYYVNRLLIFMGQPIRHGGLHPSWNLRFFRRGVCRYEQRIVHEHMVCTGASGYLRNAMLHLRRETLTQYIDKHIHYADLEAQEWVRRSLGESRSAPASQLFRRTLRLRQYLRREIWPRLPGRPAWRFLYMYVARFGFLDGRAGWRLAMLMASYEYMIGLLYREKLEAAKRDT